MMGFVTKIRSFLLEPCLKGVDYDSNELIDLHRRILTKKTMLLGVFLEFYKDCRNLERQYFTANGPKVEIGAGASLFKLYYPDILATDVKKASHLDMTVDAQKMPFKKQSISSLYGINCFHHFSEPATFFCELERVLIPGGGCILIEPYYGLLASRFYQNLFESEHFTKDQAEWSQSGLGYMHGANQALSYIVFKRDQRKLNDLFPQLKIVHMEPLRYWPRYFFSGGLNFKQLLPDKLIPLVKVLEWFLSPYARICALHHIIVISKNAS